MTNSNDSSKENEKINKLKSSSKEDKNYKIIEINKKSCKIIDIKIFPYRFLKAETSEKILNKIYELNGIVRVLIHGPSLPKKVSYGPAKGLDINHQNRKTIKVQGKDIDLRLNVGEIIITITLDNLNNFMDQLEDILIEEMPCNYITMIGIFSKTKTTISDYLKYGEGFEKHIDPRFIGMVDPKSKSSETIKMIND